MGVKGMEETCTKKTQYLTQQEVAGRFRVTQSTVKNWREKGLLRYLRVPGSTRVMYPADAVEELEQQSLRQEKEVVKPKVIKRERPGISPKEQKEWRI
jgi:predicted site-specific integrase-resolvase